MNSFNKSNIMSLVKQIRLFYLFFIIITVTFAFIANIFQINTTNEEVKISLESIMIVMNLATIPFSLKYFSKKINLLNDNTDMEEKQKLYKCFSVQRLLLLGSVIILNLVIFMFLGKGSCLICSCLIYLTTIFFFPTTKRISSDLSGITE